ncbi:hypothetical protein [Yeosuana sp.]|uniref:hypothetical protein n=1 Tax=Yeosuana sp. TaxID=2529388 RepID=UPI004054DB93|tara:strand:- start:187 stop:549 length:363 start_codon:yes stop_codon:yes gene_type:complete
MRKYVLAGFVALGALTMNAQDVMNKSITVEKGDVIEIGYPSTSKYKHIKFPRANFIIKRGGIANYKAALGEEVVVTNVKTKNDGSTMVTVKRKDGKRFFNTVSTVFINFEDALATKEIKL